MKIHEFHKTHLHNDEMFMFATETRDLIMASTAETLKIAPQFAVYLERYNRLDEGLKKIIKSALTAKIQNADKARDDIYTGMAETVKAALKHYNETVRDAASRLNILFHTYGNIAVKPLNEQTSAIINVLQDLRGQYSADAQSVGISGWVAELETRNNALETLVKARFSETAGKTDIVVKDARAELDAAYETIVERINALVVIEGPQAYEAFIRLLNAVIAKYTAILNARLGRRHHRHGGGEDADADEAAGEEGGNI